jgi:serine/threonine-protein kinase
MLTPEQFARVKALFDRLVDLPAADRKAVLEKLDDAPEVLAELHLLLGNTLVDDARYAGPVLAAMLAGQPAAVSTGTVLGAWTLGAEIGEGGMGKVFAAERSDGHYEQSAAIKLLSGIASSQALRYLARERQILASLSHPNIARIIDGGTTPHGQPYIVMERVDGVPIDRYCEQHQLPREARLRLLIDICGAVDFAHRQLIVHCDLKPSNILVTADGRPMLLDFGISRRLLEGADGSAGSDGTSSTIRGTAQTTSKAYTPRYASPEQIRNDRVGTATDIYSLGRVIAELLGVRLDDRERLDLSALPLDLAAIIALATAPAAADRYASCAALAADLRRYLNDLPVSARPATVVYIGTRWLRRHWPWAAAGLAFVATIALFSWQMRNERDAALAAEQASRAVTAFMSSVFQAADPEIAGRRDLPVSELLDAGRDRLAEQLQAQPRVRAELQGILGGVYQGIGRREQALAQYDQALAALPADESSPLRASLLRRKADSIYHLEDFVAAEPIARQALALNTALAPESIEQIHSLRLLGGILLYQGQREEAEPLLQQALQLALQLTGPDSTETARVRLDLGRLYAYFGLGAEQVIEYGSTAAQALARIHGTHHPLHVDALEIQALGLNLANQFDQAIPLAGVVSEQRIRLYGEHSPQAGYGLYTYADALASAGRNLQALPQIERSIEIQQRLAGADQLALTAPLLLRAYIETRAGLLESALTSVDRIIALHQQADALDRMELIEAHFYRARVLRLLGRWEQARIDGLQVLEQRSKDPSTPPYWLFKAQLEMVALERSQGLLEAAQARLDGIDLAALGADGWHHADLLLERARLDRARGQYDRALEQLQAAEDLLKPRLGQQHPELWLERIERAEVLAAMGRSDEAQALAGEILARAAPTIATDGHWADRLTRLSE